MSQAPAPLPESNDPFEILGVEPSVDAVELRRAYVRLIKVHRPDRHPDAFARVRKAYEEARGLLGSWQTYDHVAADDTDDDEDDYEEQVDEVAARITAAWTAISEGTDARRVLLTLREPQGDERIAMHRFLLADAADAGAREEILSALGRGAPVASWLATLLTREELAALVLEEAFSWRVLAQQSSAYDAGCLAQFRIHQHILQGRLDLAIQEVLDDAYVRAAEDAYPMQAAGREVLAVAAWAGMTEIDRLQRRYGADLVEDFPFLSPEDHRAAGKALFEDWCAWRREFPRFRALRRFLVLVPLLHDVDCLPLVDELAADFLLDATPYAVCFTRMGAISPELLERFILAAASLSWPEDEVPLYTDLVEDLKQRIRRAAGEREFGTTERYYERVVQPVLTRFVVVRGVPPEALLEELARRPDHHRTLQPYSELIRDDRMLVALHWCWRLTRFGVT